MKDKLRKVMEARQLSLRDVANRTGVSFSTISRFLRSHGTINMTNYNRLDAWLNGTPHPKPKLVSTKQIKVGGRRFLITIEAQD